MDAASSSSRRERGLLLAKNKARAFRQISANVFFVPSQTNTGSGYVVDMSAERCSCPDAELTGGACKHQYAVRYFRHEWAMPDGTTIVTETIESVRISYPQDWPAYNRAQCEEKERVQFLLRGLCDGIVPPAQKMGRKRFPLHDVVYGATMKVYSTMSGRRSTTDLKTCEGAGHMDKAPAYNTIFKYMEKPELLPVLKTLVEQSARPLVAVEQDFAADGTGFATPTYARYFDYKHNDDRRVQKWVQLCAMTGVRTNVITAAEVTDGTASELPEFPKLVERTAAGGFRMREVSADKLYLTHANLAIVEAHGAQPYIPMKANSRSTGSPAWERLFHIFSLEREKFLAHYHKRSNVESTFGSLKRKFGANVRSKTEAAQFNEVLLKCLCHNLSMLVHAIHELEIEPHFWMPREVNA